MNSEFARTFLAVVDTGSFVNAAERLHVTQSTVSTRIQTLEQQLGCVLFSRSKAGAVLTHAGRQFQRHASALVRTVEQARHEVGAPQTFKGTINVGGRIGLWEGFLLRWMATVREWRPDIAIRAQSGLEVDLMAGLMEGRFDVGVMYTPQRRPGLVVEKLFDERLVLVSTREGASDDLGSDYVYVDWGAEFYRKHSASFAEFAGAAVTANVGWLGLRYILSEGGSGYFPDRIVRNYVESGVLAVRRDAPAFTIPAYVVFYKDHEPLALLDVLDMMRNAASTVRSGVKSDLRAAARPNPGQE